MRRSVLAVSVLGALLTGCAKNIHTKEAVEEALLKHLATVAGLDVKAMKIEVGQVAFREKEADATVRFTPNGMDASQGMAMSYTLEVKDGAWKVKGKRGGMHGGGGEGAAGAPGGEGAAK